MWRRANARRVTVAGVSPASGRPYGLFAGGLHRGGLGRPLRGELLDARIRVAVQAFRATPRGAQHAPGHGLRGDGAIDLVLAGEQRIDERRKDAPRELQRPQVLAWP